MSVGFFKVDAVKESATLNELHADYAKHLIGNPMLEVEKIVSDLPSAQVQELKVTLE